MVKDTLLVTICLILSGVLGFIAQIVFVNSFGASGEMDIYFTLLSTPAIVTGVAPMIFSSVLIPTFAKLKSDRFELNNFINTIFIVVLVFAIFFILIGSFISLINIDLIIPVTHTNLRNTGIQISLMVWIGSGFNIISSYLSAILYYNKQFFKVAWTSILPSSLMIIFVLLFHERLGVRSISLGFCIAFILQFIIFLRSSTISLIIYNFNINHIPYKKLLLKQSILVFLSLLPFTIFVPIGYFWASQLEVGSASYLGYSQSFAGFLSVAVSMGISIVSFPELADNFVTEKGESSLHEFELKLRYVILVAMFVAGIFIALRIPILTIFYQRGSFDAESVNKLASVIPWYFLAAIFVGGLNLLRTLFYSKGEFEYLAKLGLVIPIIYFVLAGALKENFSFVGIGVANALTYAVLFFFTVYLARNKQVMFLTNNFLFFILKNAITVIVSSLFIILSLPFMLNLTSKIVSISASLLLYSIVYMIFSKFIFRLKEIDEIMVTLITKLKTVNK